MVDYNAEIVKRFKDSAEARFSSRRAELGSFHF